MILFQFTQWHDRSWNGFLCDTIGMDQPLNILLKKDCLQWGGVPMAGIGMVQLKIAGESVLVNWCCIQSSIFLHKELHLKKRYHEKFCVNTSLMSFNMYWNNLAAPMQSSHQLSSVQGLIKVGIGYILLILDYSKRNHTYELNTLKSVLLACNILFVHQNWFLCHVQELQDSLPTGLGCGCVYVAFKGHRLSSTVTLTLSFLGSRSC